MLMELLEGRTLPRFLAEGPTVGHAMEALLDGCKALAVLHDQGVRHRDVKPGNLFILADGRAVLLDLGICQTHVSDPITGPEEFIGTPPYVSPEYAADVLNHRRAGRRASPREDIYALGVCLYEVLIGSRPTRTLPSARPEQLLEEIATVRPRHPGDVQPEAKALALLADLAMRWIDKEPRNRPAMGLDAVRDLEEALDKCGDALAKPLPVRPGGGQIISIGWARPGVLGRRRAALHPLGIGELACVSQARETPRRRSMHRWAANAAIAMALAVTMMMGFTTLVLVVRLSRWLLPAAQTNGHGPGEVNEAGKDQAPTKPPPPIQDQKRPPCEPKYQIEMEGGCWQRHRSKVCDNGFKLNGKCYVPVLPDSGPPVADP